MKLKQGGHSKKPGDNNNPLSLRNLAAGIFVGVIGTLLAQWLITRVFPSQPTEVFLSTPEHPPHYGAFLRDAQSRYVEIPDKKDALQGEAKPGFQDSPTIADRRPTFIVWEPRIDSPNIALDKEETFSAGISSFAVGDYPVISGAIPKYCSARNVGLTGGERVLAEDGKSTAGHTPFWASSRGPYGSTVTITVDRNGRQSDVVITRDIEDYSRDASVGPLITSPNGELLEITPGVDLTSGIYCLKAGTGPYSKAWAWCIVEK